MRTFEEIESLVIDWAKDKGILEKATKLTQASKTLEEYNEMLLALITNNKDELIDSIGDQVVTLIIQAHMNGVTVVQCLNVAYNVIKDRKGKMINGQFVKE